MICQAELLTDRKIQGIQQLKGIRLEEIEKNGHFSEERKKRHMHTGLHKLWYPGIRDRSTWGKFGAHGEHGDVFLFSNLGAL